MQVYLGNITKKEAEDMLRQDPYADGKFLVRDNVQYQGDLTLSVAFSERASGAQKFAHYRIAKDKMQMFYICEERKFINIRQLVDYYMNQQSGLVAKLGICFKSKTGKNKVGQVVMIFPATFLSDACKTKVANRKYPEQTLFIQIEDFLKSFFIFLRAR